MNVSAAVVLGMVIRACVPSAVPSLRADGDKLPEAAWSDGSSVVFAKNGYMVVRRNGTCLADCGLYYQGPGFKPCAYQLRRVDQTGTVAVDASSERIEFSDRLYHQVSPPDTQLKFEPLIKYTQRVTIEASGLHVCYEVEALRPLKAGYLGAYVHLPTARYAGAGVRFFPGFGSSALPGKQPKGWLFNRRARRFIVAEGTGMEVQLAVPHVWQWLGTDERPYRLNIYRAQFAVPVKGGALRVGQPIGFEFRLIVAQQPAQASASMGSARVSLTPGGCLEVARGQKQLAQIGVLLKDRRTGRTRSSLMESFGPAWPTTDGAGAGTGCIAGRGRLLGGGAWRLSLTATETIPGRQRTDGLIDASRADDRYELAGLQILVDESEFTAPKGEDDSAVGHAHPPQLSLVAEQPKGVCVSLGGAAKPVTQRRMAGLGARELVVSVPAAEANGSDVGRAELRLTTALDDYVAVKPEPKRRLPAERRRKETQSKSIAILPDDRHTRGNWLGRYGSYAYILCGMGGEHTFSDGPGCGRVKYAYYTGRKDEQARAWMSYCQTDDRPLLNPTEFHLIDVAIRRMPDEQLHPDGHLPRLPSVWDDHAEVHRSPGPNLYVDLWAPPGLHQLSFYFFEIDWLQHRAHCLNLRERTWSIGKNAERKVGDLLANVSVSDFFGGVYKRFLIRGPLKLQVEIERLDSPNAVVSGIFLDPVFPVYELAHPFAYASDADKRKGHVAHIPELVAEAFVFDRDPSSIIGAAGLPRGADEREGTWPRAYQAYLAYVSALRPPGQIDAVRSALDRYCASLAPAFGTATAMDELASFVRFFLRHQDGRQAAIAGQHYLALLRSGTVLPSEADRLLSLSSAFWRNTETRRGLDHQIRAWRTPRHVCGYRLLTAYFAECAKLPREDQLVKLKLAAQQALKRYESRTTRLIYRYLADAHGLAVLSPKERFDWGCAQTSEAGRPRHAEAVTIWEALLADGDLSGVSRDDLYVRLSMACLNSRQCDKALAFASRLLHECPESRWFGGALSRLESIPRTPAQTSRARHALERFLDEHPGHDMAPKVRQVLAALISREAKERQ